MFFLNYFVVFYVVVFGCVLDTLLSLFIWCCCWMCMRHICYNFIVYVVVGEYVLDTFFCLCCCCWMCGRHLCYVVYILLSLNVYERHLCYVVVDYILLLIMISLRKNGSLMLVNIWGAFSYISCVTILQNLRLNLTMQLWNIILLVIRFGKNLWSLVALLISWLV